MINQIRVFSALAICVCATVTGQARAQDGACCFGATCQAPYNQFDCEKSGGKFQGPGTTCAEVECGGKAGTGACCLNTVDCVTATEADCLANKGFYHGDDTLCENVDCNVGFFGACCVGDVCNDGFSVEDCASQKGVFQGAGSQCKFVECGGGPQTGACCNFAADTCFQSDFAGCPLGMGIWQGAGTTCATSCPPNPTTGACCFIKGCAGFDQEGCDAVGGTFYEGFECGEKFICPPCVADINFDFTVDVLDLLQVIGQWGNSGGSADINFDGTVDVLDLLLVISEWGPC